MKKTKKNAANTASDQVIRLFWEIFNYRYNFLESINPYFDPKTGALKEDKNGKLKPDWRTETRGYPIRHKFLEAQYRDPAELIGLSFNSKTRYCCLDVDWLSKYHPEVDEVAFRGMLGELESIGLVCPVFVRSSFSEGLHVFYFFNEEIGTFNLACALDRFLKEKGITIKSGTLELFPNAKGYKSNWKESHYKGLKLPLQPMTGSCIIDDDFNPIADDIETFEKIIALSAANQDLDLLKTASTKYGNLVRLQRCSRGQGSLQKFEAQLKKAISLGFTGKGQTNHLLLDIGCQGVVFRGLDEPESLQDLADYIKKTITNLEGYEQYCGHQHEIDKRCLEIAKSSQSYYWAAGKPRKREKVTYKDNFGKVLDNASNGLEAKKLKATQKIEAAISQIEAEITKGLLEIPKTLTDYTLLIVQSSKKLFGSGVSKETLYKPNNKPIWKTAFATLVAATQILVAEPIKAEQPQTITTRPIVEITTIETEAKDPTETTKKPNLKPAPKNSPKTARTRIDKEKFGSEANRSKSKPPEPAENKDSSEVALYVGFVRGEALSQNKSSDPHSSEIKTSISKTYPQESASDPQIDHKQGLSELDLVGLENLRQQKLEELRIFDSRCLSSQLPKERPAPIAEQVDYFQQMVARDPQLKAQEQQRIEPEYAKLQKNAFARINALLHRSRGSSGSDLDQVDPDPKVSPEAGGALPSKPS